MVDVCVSEDGVPETCHVCKEGVEGSLRLLVPWTERSASGDEGGVPT